MTLRMGDRPYAEAAWVSQYTHHPGAPVQYGISEMLRAPYMDSQNHGRNCLQQGWPFDVQDLSGDLSNVRAMRLSSAVLWGGVTRGYRRVPREISHLRCLFVFVLQTFSETQVGLRLTAIDGAANTDTNTRTEIIDADPRTDAAGLNVRNGRIAGGHTGTLVRLADAEFPFAGPFAVHVGSVDLAFVNIDTENPGTCEIRLEAQANAIRDNSGTYVEPVGIRPLWVSVDAVMDDFSPALVDTAEGASTLSPLSLSYDQDVIAENLRRIHRVQDWSMRRRPTCHLGLLTALDGWDDYAGGSTEAIGTLDVTPGAAFERVIHTNIRIEPEDATNGSMTCGAECNLAVGDTVEITFRFTGSLGTVNIVVTCTDANNGSEVSASSSLSTATTGDERIEVSIFTQRTAGTGPSEVRTLRVEEDELGSLPGPQND